MSTEHYGFPLPDGTESAKLHRDLKKLGDAVDATLKGQTDDLRSESQLETDLIKVTLYDQKYEFNVSEYGAIGDGVADDTVALQNAINAANGRTLVLPKQFNCLITNTINLPPKLVLRVEGMITCRGDVDYWFRGEMSQEIKIDSFRAIVTKDFSERLLLNRVLYFNAFDRVEIVYAEITGGSTSIHALNGNQFICRTIFLKDVLGVNAQYGYGVNSSAKTTKINFLSVVNASSSHGRHAIYINGSQWENVAIDYVYVKNFNKNPINIANTNFNAKANLVVTEAFFDTVNMNPTASSTGAIHVGDENGPDVLVRIGSVTATNTAGTVVGAQGTGANNMFVGDVIARNLPVAANANTYLVHLRGGTGKQVRKVWVSELTTNWLSAVYMRDVVNADVGEVYAGGSGPYQAVRLNNTTVSVGAVMTDGIDKFYETGSVVTYKTARQKIRYQNSSPTTGTGFVGDIVYNLTPDPGEFIGWVCVVAGTPGTWKGFGLIQT